MSSLHSHWAATAMGVYWGLEEPILTSISIHRHHHFHHHHHNFEKINITINHYQLKWDLAASAHLLAWKKTVSLINHSLRIILKFTVQCKRIAI